MNLIYNFAGAFHASRHAPSGVDPLSNYYTSQVVPSYAGTTRTGSYDSVRNVYRGDVVTRRALRAALGKGLAGQILVPFAGIGDSAMAGWQGIPGTTDPIVLLRKQLAASGYPVTGGWVVPNNGTPSAQDPRWTLSSNWNGLGTTDAFHINSFVSGSTASFTEPLLGGTVLEFAVFCNTTQNLNVSIDGVAQTPVSVTANVLKKFTYSGLSATTAHTLLLTVTTTSGMWLAGARCRATTGISLGNFAIYGSEPGNWVPTYNSSAFYNPINLALGLETPTISIMGLGGNDAVHTGHTIAGMTADLVTVGQTIQTSGSALFMKTYMPLDDSIVAAGSGGVWTSWVSGMYDAADTLGVMLIDHTDAMGTNALCITQGLAYTDKIHPVSAGYAAIARRDFLGLAV